MKFIIHLKYLVIAGSLLVLSCNEEMKTGPVQCNEYVQFAKIWIWPTMESIKELNINSIHINASYPNSNVYDNGIITTTDSVVNIYTAVSSSKAIRFPGNVKIIFESLDSIIDSLFIPISMDQNTMIYSKEKINGLNGFDVNSSQWIDKGCGNIFCWVTEKGSGQYECVE